MISDRINIIDLPVREAISYDFEDFRLDLKRQELQHNGEPVTLTPKAYQVLLLLVQNPEQTIEKEDIYKELWGDNFVEDANLTQHIYVLRKTLGKTSTGGPFIETVSRTGYRFLAKVQPEYPSTVSEAYFRPRSSGAEPAFKREPIPFTEPHLRLAGSRPMQQSEPMPVVVSQPAETDNDTTRRDRKRWLFSIAALAFVAAAILLAVYFRPATPTDSPIRSVAVLPFRPIGEATQNDKLGLGMADSIITRLSKLQQIPVRPTSSIVRYTDIPATNSMDAGKEMGVDTVLEGTVQHDGERVRVAVKLIEVSSGKSLWAENFDESYTNIFSVQDSISQKVVRALAINLTQQQQKLLSQNATTNVQALEAYQMGVYLYSTRSKENLTRSIQYFEDAVRFDPNFARAYAIEADAYNMLRYYGYIEPVEARAKTSALVTKAMDLNREIPEAYIALANLQMNERDGLMKAKASLEKAIELSPYNGTARLRYAWLLVNDDIKAASEQMRLSQEYDPLSGVTNGAYCNVLTYEQRFDEAIRFCERAVDLSSESPASRILLADVYSLSGRHADALEQIEKRIQEANGVEKLTAEGSKAYYLINAGRSQEALPIYAKLKAAASTNPQLLPDLIVLAYEFGRSDEGISYFETAFRSRGVSILSLNHSPIWKKVNSDPRVSELVNRIRKESEEKKTP